MELDRPPRQAMSCFVAPDGINGRDGVGNDQQPVGEAARCRRSHFALDALVDTGSAQSQGSCQARKQNDDRAARNRIGGQLIERTAGMNM